MVLTICTGEDALNKKTVSHVCFLQTYIIDMFAYGRYNQIIGGAQLWESISMKI